MRTGSDHRGFTLLEITVILAVIAILALVLAPSIFNFLTQTRLARALDDVQVLADAVVSFHDDNGFYPKYADPSRSQEIRLLVSPGDAGRAMVGAEPWTATDLGTVDLISNHLINNQPMFGGSGYPLMTRGSSGWDGPYVSGELGPDPWGNRYVINVEFLAVGRGAVEADGLQEKRAVWALSAGPDGFFDTTYPTTGVQLVGAASASPADISARIQ